MIQRAAGGDGDAFGMLFEKHFQTIYNYVLWLCNDPDQAEDLTQETFIRAHRSLGQLGPPWRIKPWLYRLAHNLFIDYARQKKPVHPLDPDAPIPSNEDNPERQLMAAELSGPVRSALKRLAPNYREALVLREVQGFPYAEIAEVMGLSVDHVKVLLHRARASFKDHYGVGLLMEKQARRCTVLNEMLDAFQDGELTPAQQQQVRAHVKDCAACQQRQREMAALFVLMGAQRVFNLPPLLHGSLLGIPGQAAAPVLGGAGAGAGAGAGGGAPGVAAAAAGGAVAGAAGFAGAGGGGGGAGAGAGYGSGGAADTAAKRRRRWTRSGVRQLTALSVLCALIILAFWLMLHFSFISLPHLGGTTPTQPVDAAGGSVPPGEGPTPTGQGGGSQNADERLTGPGTQGSTQAATDSAAGGQCFCEVSPNTGAWDGNWVCATSDGVTVSSKVDLQTCPLPSSTDKKSRCTCIINPTTGTGYCKENRAQTCK